MNNNSLPSGQEELSLTETGFSPSSQGNEKLNSQLSHLPSTSEEGGRQLQKTKQHLSSSESSNEDALLRSPGQLGFVRSSEARPVTRLEVRIIAQ